MSLILILVYLATAFTYLAAEDSIKLTLLLILQGGLLIMCLEN